MKTTRHALAFFAFALSTVLASNAWAVDQSIQSAVSPRVFSKYLPDDWACTEAMTEATDRAQQKCSEIGFDGQAQTLSSVGVRYGRLDASNPADQKYINEGYRTFCIAKSVVRCKREGVYEPKPARCLVDSYLTDTFNLRRYKVVLRAWQHDGSYAMFGPDLKKGFMTYMDAYNYAARVLVPAIHCELSN